MIKIVIALTAFAFLLYAQSQPPSPGPRKTIQNDKGNGSDKQTVASHDHSDSDSISAAVNKLTSEVASWKKQQAAAQNKDHTSSNGWLIGSTVVSAFATITIAVLAFFQWRAMHKQRLAMEAQTEYMRDALKETRESVKAATKSAEASEVSAQAAKFAADSAAQVERAWVIVDVGGSAVEAQYTIENLGRTPAWVTEVSGDYRKLAKGANVLNEYTTLPSWRVETGWISPPHVKSQPFSAKLPGKIDMQQVKDANLFLVFMGEVKYADIFGKERETRVCVTFVPGTNRWFLYGPPECNRRT